MTLPSSIIQTTDGGYLITGFTASNDLDVSGNHGGNFDAWAVKKSIAWAIFNGQRFMVEVILIFIQHLKLLKRIYLAGRSDQMMETWS